MFDLVFLIVFVSAIAWMLAGGVFTVLSFVAFDRLLRRVWADSEEAWIKLGKPSGFFWVPRGARCGFLTGFVRSGLYEQGAAVDEEPFAGCAEGLGRLRRYQRLAGAMRRGGAAAGGGGGDDAGGVSAGPSVYGSGRVLKSRVEVAEGAPCPPRRVRRR